MKYPRIPWKQLSALLLILVIVFLIHARWTTFEGAGKSLRTAQPGWVIIALLLQTLALLLYAWGIQSALSKIRVKTSLMRITLLTLRAFPINLVVPGGMANTVLFSSESAKRGSTWGEGLLATLTAQSIDFVLFWVIALLSLIALTGRSSHLILVATLGILVVASLVLYRIHRRFHPLAYLLKQANTILEQRNLPSFTGDAGTIVRSTIQSFSLLGFLSYIPNVAIVYCILRAFGIHLGLEAILATYVAVTVAHVASPIPQGIGLAEGAFASVLVAHGISLEHALSAGITYRIVTFWIPAALGTYGSIHQHLLTTAKHRLAIYGVAFLMVIMAGINIISAIEPPFRHRLHILESIFPLTTTSYGRFITLVAGLAILLLVQGILRRKRSSYYAALTISLISVASHLIKGLDFDEAFVALFLAGWLYLLRDQFTTEFDRTTIRSRMYSLSLAVLFFITYGVFGSYRFAHAFGATRSFKSALAVFPKIAFGTQSAHGFFAHEFSNSLQLLGAGIVLFSAWLLLRPVLVQKEMSLKDKERARTIIEKYGDSSLATLCLYPDKKYWFSSQGSVVAYAVHHRVAIALGDPIGPDSSAISEWKGFCQKNDWIPAFYQTTPQLSKRYSHEGFDSFDIGQEALINCKEFTLEGAEIKSVRNAHNKIMREGFTAEILSPPHAGDLLVSLRDISTTWLKNMNGTEKQFSLGWFDEDLLRDQYIAVVRDDHHEIVAFATLHSRFKAGGYAIDLMRQTHKHNGVIELLFVTIISWLSTQEHPLLSLGLSPLAETGTEKDSSPEERVARQVYLRMRKGYNFSGLHNFKSRFLPEWEPRYLWYLGRNSLPVVLTAIVTANAGGSLRGYFSIRKKETT